MGGPQEPLSTKTETAACEIATGAIASLLNSKDLSRFEATRVKDREAFESNLAELKEMQPLLKSEGSALVTQIAPVLENMTIISLVLSDSDKLNEPSAVAQVLSNTRESYHALEGSCMALGIYDLASYDLSSLSPETLFSESAWLEGSTQESFYFYTTSLNEVVTEIFVDGDSYAYKEVSGTQSKIQILCATGTSNRFGILALSRHWQDFDPVELGPDGVVGFEYSIDGGPYQEGTGFFGDGSLFLFAESLYDFINSKSEFINELLLAEQTFSVKVDSPGVEFESVFPVWGIREIALDLHNARCFNL